MRKIIPLLLFSFTIVLSCMAQTPTPKMPYPNGEVKALAAYGDTIIVGGQFSEVYTYVNSSNKMGVFDTVSKTFLPANIKVQNGMIKKVIPDGNNTGYYVAGSFTVIGDSSRKGIAHIDTAGNVTGKFSRFNPLIYTAFNDLYLRGDTLLAGGRINNICDSCKQYKSFSTINTTTGQLSQVLQSIDGQVDAMADDGSGGWYLGGTFTVINGVQRYHAARIDSLGNVLPWNPVVRGYTIHSIYKDSGSIFIGGQFDMVGGSQRIGLAEVDSFSGVVTSFNPKVGGSVREIIRWSNRLIVGGSFYTVGDSARQNIVLIDLATHKPTATQFNIDGIVLTFALAGNTLYIGGDFFSVNGVLRRNLASVNVSTGAINALTLNVAGLLATSFTIYEMVLYSGQLYVAGQSFPTNSSFTQAAGVVAINPTSGAILQQYTVPANAIVNSIVLSGTTLYALGNFTTFNVLNRNKLAAINLSTNTVAPFNPLVAFAASNYINSGYPYLGMQRNGSLFIAHDPLTSGVSLFNNGFSGTGIIGLHTTSDSVFTMNHQLAGEVNSMAVFNDTLYIGGEFKLYARNRPTDSIRVNFAGISLTTFDPTNAYVYVNGPVNALLMYGSTVVAGGDFAPQGLIGYDIAAQSQLYYSRSFGGNIKSMALHNSTIYMAGDFSTGVGLVATSALWYGNHVSWSNGSVYGQSVAVYNNKLYACGTWSASGPSQMRTYNLPTRTLDQTITIPQGSITSFCSAGRYMKMWGTFLSLGGIVPANNLFAYSRSTGKIIFSNLGVNLTTSPTEAAVNDLLISGKTLYIGGNFNLIAGKSRQSLAAVNLVADTLASWNYPVNGTVLSMDTVGNNLYVAGIYDMVGVNTRQSLCSFNLGTGLLTTWNPLVVLAGWSSPYIRQVKTTTDRVYIVGNFTSINGTPIQTIAAFNQSSGSLLNWNPWASSAHFKLRVDYISYLAQMGSDMYALCNTTLGQSEVWSINTVTGFLKPGWRNPILNNNAKTLVPYRNGLLIPGAHEGGMIHMDTVSGNTSRVKLTSDVLTAAPSTVYPSGTFVNTVLIDNNDRMICGGNFALLYNENVYDDGVYYSGKYLAETGISASRCTMTVSSKGLCFDTPIEITVSGFDSSDHHTYIAELSIFNDQYNTIQAILGTITLPLNPSCRFMFPAAYGATTDLKLRLSAFPPTTPDLEVPYPVRVGPKPLTPMLSVIGRSSVCEEKTITLQGTDFPPTMYTFNWTRNDTLLPDAAVSRYVTSKSGTYRMFLTNEIGCYDSSAAKVVNVSGHCAAPSDLRFKNVSAHAATLIWNKGSGAKSIVIATADAAVTAIPENGFSYLASPVFANGSDLGNMNYVVYNGSGNSVTVTALDSARTYYFTVVEYDDSAALTSYIIPNTLMGNITTPSRVYYAKSTGVLNQLSTWGTNPDGSGIAPTNFTYPALYKIRRNPASVLSANWILGNAGSYVEIEDTVGGLPKEVTIPAGMKINGYGLQIKGRNKLIVSGDLNMHTVWAVDSSVVVFNGLSGQVIPPYSYSRLQVTNAVKTTGGQVNVTDSLSLASVIISATDTLTLGTSGSLAGGVLVRTDGYIQGPFRRWIRTAVPATNMGLMPVGANGKYQPLQLDLIANPSASTYNIVSHFIPGTQGLVGLPITDQGIAVNTMTTEGIWRLLKQDTLTGLMYKLTATANGYASVNDYSTTRLLFRNPGSNWQRFGNSTIISGTNLSYSLTKDSVSLFGEFGIGSDTALNMLPVKMLTFTGQLQPDKTVKLFWQTGNELNNNFFAIQRSTDGVNFRTIGRVKGNGTTHTVTNYRYDDRSPALSEGESERLYYRLIQNDFDGVITYSKTIAILLPTDNEAISLIPNPANDFITIQGLLNDAVVKDILGNDKLNIKGNGIVDISALQPGVYMLHAGSRVVKFVKY